MLLNLGKEKYFELLTVLKLDLSGREQKVAMIIYVSALNRKVIMMLCIYFLFYLLKDFKNKAHHSTYLFMRDKLIMF